MSNFMSEVNEEVMNILETRTVLVIDPEEDVCDLVRQDLKIAGMHVDMAHDSHSGDKLIRSGKYDVLLVDKQVRGISSDNLVNLAKEYGMKTVKFSSDDSHSNKFDATVGKPFDQGELTRVIRGV